VAGCCECGYEPSGTGATELVSYQGDVSLRMSRSHKSVVILLI
jgi:hypothetical protein